MTGGLLLCGLYVPGRELHLLDGSLRGGQTGDGHTEGGAGHVVQAHLVAELHAAGIAAVLAADAQVLYAWG